MLTIYAFWTAFCIYACYKWKVYDDFRVIQTYSDNGIDYNYWITKLNYFDETTHPSVYVDLGKTDTDLFSDETQIKEMRFEDALQRCENCETKWFKPNTLDSWFHQVRAWIDEGSCWVGLENIDPFRKTIDPEVFRNCY